MKISDVMTFKEAQDKWGLGESTLRGVVNRSNRLVNGVDYRKSAGTYLITKDAMIKLFGIANGEFDLDKKYPTILKNINYEEMENFILEVMDYTYNVKKVLFEEVNCLDCGCEMIFEMHNNKFKIYRHELIIENEDTENEFIIDRFDIEKIK